MKRLSSSILLAGIALNCLVPVISQVPEVAVPKLPDRVKLDGVLDDAVWSKAAKVGPFVNNDGTAIDDERTFVRIFYTGEALYLGWEMSDRDIEATLVKRDSRFWEEEVVEFFLTTGPLTRYYELQWNPLGGVFDAIIENRLDAQGKSLKFTGDWDYTARGMRSEVKVAGTVSDPSDRDRSWTVEVRIPFADLNTAAPAAGTRWRGNFYRFNRGGNRPAQKQAWSPTRDASFHQPSRFGTIRFLP